MNKWERVNGRHFWNPGVFSYAMIPRCRANSKVLFPHRRIYSLWSCTQARHNSPRTFKKESTCSAGINELGSSRRNHLNREHSSCGVAMPRPWSTSGGLEYRFFSKQVLSPSTLAWFPLSRITPSVWRQSRSMWLIIWTLGYTHQFMQTWWPIRGWRRSFFETHSRIELHEC